MTASKQTSSGPSVETKETAPSDAPLSDDGAKVPGAVSKEAGDTTAKGQKSGTAKKATTSSHLSSDDVPKVPGTVPPVAASAHFTKEAAQRHERERWVRRLSRKYHPYG